MRAIFASHNPHKAEQVAVLLPGVDLVPLDDIAPDLELEEPFDTFRDNALAKARAVVAATGTAAIADDSGVEVDALGGAPGVYSARYAGDGATDADNNRKLIDELAKVPGAPRACRYRCVAVLVMPDGRELVAEGSCEGTVVDEARGDMGFGYDPHVVPDGETRTMAEIPLEEKLAFSHRGRAFRVLERQIRVIEASDAAARLRTERGMDNLAEDDLDPDPLAQFGAWLGDALEAHPGEPNAMTLATASGEGEPSSRTVLLRGFDERGFVFYTNRDSRKGRDLGANPRASLTFHWGTLQRQVTISGGVEELPDGDSDAYFAARPRGHQLGAWASHQSEPLQDRAALEARLAEVTAEFEGGDVPRPPYWGGYRVVPRRIEFWQGRPDRLHDRFVYERTGEDWTITRLNP